MWDMMFDLDRGRCGAESGNKNSNTEQTDPGNSMQRIRKVGRDHDHSTVALSHRTTEGRSYCEGFKYQKGMPA